jgi:hypothetical protein
MLCLVLASFCRDVILFLLQPLFSKMVFQESTCYYFSSSLSSCKLVNFILMEPVLMDNHSQDLVDSCWSICQRLQFSKQTGKLADGMRCTEVLIYSSC